MKFPHRTLLALGITLLAVPPTVAQKRASSGPGPAPAPAAAAPAERPQIALPLSPGSAAAAEQIARIANEAGAILGPLPEHASLTHEFGSLPLPPRPADFATSDERQKKQTRTDYDFVQFRTVGDRWWLLAAEYFLVSAPNDPSAWPILKKNPSLPRFVDVFARAGRTWLLTDSWLAETSPDGTRLRDVPHLAPRDVTVRRNLAVLSGGSIKRNAPDDFRHVTVWRDKAWIANGAGAHFVHDRFLANVPLASLGGKFDLFAADDSLVAIGYAINRETPTVHRSTDGRTWTTREPTYNVTAGSGERLAYGNGRLVHADITGIRYSADGVVWSKLADPLVPEATIEVKASDGTYRKENRGVNWRHLTFADEFFFLVGEAYEPGRRHEQNATQSDTTIAAYSKDGIHWHVTRLPIRPAYNWLATGRNGRFLLVPQKLASEITELRISWKIAHYSRHPNGGHWGANSIRGEIDEAMAKRDARTAAARLLELEKFFPSEATLRLSAAIRAQLGDLDGAWTALDTLEKLVPSDPEMAFVRASVLQAAGRVAEAQAYARWFLAQKADPWPADPQLALKAKTARFNLLVGAGQMDDAKRFAEGEVMRDKTNVEFRLLLAMLHLQRQQPVEAKRWLNEAAALGDPRAKQMLSQFP